MQSRSGGAYCHCPAVTFLTFLALPVPNVRKWGRCASAFQIPASVRDVTTAHSRKSENGSSECEQVGRANGYEPFSSVSIATSLAAHPRRSPLALARIERDVRARL